MISNRLRKKYKILKTLKNTELSIEDIKMYTNLNRLEIVPIIQDLLRYKDIKNIGKKPNYYTKEKSNIYTLKEKGREKIKYFKEKYDF